MPFIRNSAAPLTDEEVPLRASDTDAMPKELHSQRRRAMLASMVGLGFVAAAGYGYAALSGTFGRHLALRTSAEGLHETSGLAENTFMEDGKKYNMDCGDTFHLKKVVHNNLGNNGPDSGEEGIQWLAGEKRDGQYVRDVIIEAHAATTYTPFNAKWNGMNGHFAIINMPTGEDVKLNFDFFDAATKDPVTLPEVHFTFYDLDQAKPVDGYTDEELLTEGKGDTGREYVRAYGSHDHHITVDPSSELIKKEYADHRLYMSTHVGTVEDNPAEPDQLTQQQMGRAVAFTYKNTKTVNLVLGSTAGPSLRAFEFAFLNIMNCKKVLVNTAARSAEAEPAKTVQGSDESTAVPAKDPTEPAEAPQDTSNAPAKELAEDAKPDEKAGGLAEELEGEEEFAEDLTREEEEEVQEPAKSLPMLVPVGVGGAGVVGAGAVIMLLMKKKGASTAAQAVSGPTP